VSSLAKPGVENILTAQVDNLCATNRLPADVEPDGSFDWWNYGGLSVRFYPHSSRAFIAQQQIIAVPHLVAVDEADTAQSPLW